MPHAGIRDASAELTLAISCRAGYTKVLVRIRMDGGILADTVHKNMVSKEVNNRV